MGNISNAWALVLGMTHVVAIVTAFYAGHKQAINALAQDALEAIKQIADELNIGK